jgi:hypothetical protein
MLVRIIRLGKILASCSSIDSCYWVLVLEEVAPVEAVELDDLEVEVEDF